MEAGRAVRVILAFEGVKMDPVARSAIEPGQAVGEVAGVVDHAGLRRLLFPRADGDQHQGLAFAGRDLGGEGRFGGKDGALVPPDRGAGGDEGAKRVRMVEEDIEDEKAAH